MVRSVRRQTVRATWSRAASSVPAGMTNVRSGGLAASTSSIHASLSATSASSMRWIFDCCLAPSGVARSAPMSNRRDWMQPTISFRRRSNGCPSSQEQSTTPRMALSSSTVP